MRRRNEAGSIIPLTIGFFLVIATLVAVVVDASAAYLQRAGLNSVADAAALAATDGVQGEFVYTNGVGEDLVIDPAAARRFVEEYLRDSGAADRYRGLDQEVVTDGHTVRVLLRAPLDLPLAVPGVTTSTSVSAEATASVVVSK